MGQYHSKSDIKIDETLIKERSKKLWEELGRPSGRDREIWFASLNELTNEEWYKDPYTEDGVYKDW